MCIFLAPQSWNSILGINHILHDYFRIASRNHRSCPSVDSFVCQQFVVLAHESGSVKRPAGVHDRKKLKISALLVCVCAAATCKSEPPIVL